MTINRRKFVQAAGAASALAFSGNIFSQGSAIRLGLMTVKTGPLASGGIDMERALVQYLKERNNTLAGRKVELFVGDSGGVPAQARTKLQELVERKTLNPDGRNSWQSGAKDDRGPPAKDGKPKRNQLEPWTYDPRGFQAAWWEAADAGRVMYIKKWGTMDCDLKGAGKTLDDMWMLEYVEEGTEPYEVRDKANKHYLEKLAERPIR